MIEFGPFILLSLIFLASAAVAPRIGFAAGLEGKAMKYAWGRALVRTVAIIVLTTFGYYAVTWILWTLQDANAEELVEPMLTVTLAALIASSVIGSLSCFFFVMIGYNFGARRRVQDALSHLTTSESPPESP